MPNIRSHLAVKAAPIYTGENPGDGRADEGRCRRAWERPAALCRQWQLHALRCGGPHHEGLDFVTQRRDALLAVKTDHLRQAPCARVRLQLVLADVVRLAVLFQPRLLAVPVALACGAALQPTAQRRLGSLDLEHGIEGSRRCGGAIECAQAAFLQDLHLRDILHVREGSMHAERVKHAHGPPIAAVDEARELVLVHVCTPRLHEHFALLVLPAESLTRRTVEVAAAEVPQLMWAKSAHQLSAKRRLTRAGRAEYAHVQPAHSGG